MNIWICNPYDPLPGEGLGELRYGRLAQTLVAQGHSVTWWSADWSHTLKKRRVLGSRVVESAGGGSESFIHPTNPRSSKHKERSGEPLNYLTTQLISVPAYQKNISLRRVWSHLRYARGIARQGIFKGQANNISPWVSHGGAEARKVKISSRQLVSHR